MKIPVNEWAVLSADSDTAPKFPTEAEAQAYADTHGGLVVGIVDVIYVD